VHRATGEPHPDTVALIEQVAELIEAEGIEAWFALEPEALLGTGAEDYVKVRDTLDVWFDSGVTHASVLEARAGLDVPADLYLEGSDQHRGWFQSSLLTGVAMRGEAPYRAVLTHGFTVDAQGHKMSKSRGNVIAPQKVVDSLGADILRLWVASCDYSREIAVSDEILKRMADAYRRIRNTARFLLANLNGFEPASHALPAGEMLALDRWIVDQARQLQARVAAAYDEYAFHLIYQEVHNFCAVELGSFYLDVIKDRQYTTQADSVARRSCQSAMYHVLEAMTRWIAPILSFTAEEIWSHMPGERGESVLFETWYTGLFALDEDEPMDTAHWARVLASLQVVRKELEALRNAERIGSSLDAEVSLYADGALLDSLRALGDELRFVLLTSEADCAASAARSAEATEHALEAGRLYVHACPSEHAKCARCWHHRADVGANDEHPELCGRCVENVAGAGETRRYA
jgi:isoleucyl-tRNA synthetase